MGPRADDIFALVERFYTESETPLWRLAGDDFILGLLHQALAGPRARLDTYTKQSAFRAFRKVEDGAARAIQDFLRRCWSEAEESAKCKQKCGTAKVPLGRKNVVSPAIAKPPDGILHPRPRSADCSRALTDERIMPLRPTACSASPDEGGVPHTLRLRAYKTSARPTSPQVSFTLPAREDNEPSKSLDSYLDTDLDLLRASPELRFTSREGVRPATAPEAYLDVDVDLDLDMTLRGDDRGEARPDEALRLRSCTVTPTPYSYYSAKSPCEPSSPSSPRRVDTRPTPDTAPGSPLRSPSHDEAPVAPTGSARRFPQYRGVYKPRKHYGCRGAFTPSVTELVEDHMDLGDAYGVKRQELRNPQRFAYRTNRRNR